MIVHHWTHETHMFVPPYISQHSAMTQTRTNDTKIFDLTFFLSLSLSKIQALFLRCVLSLSLSPLSLLLLFF